MTSPSRIGRYRITDILGRGAMGVVYRGVDEALDRPVAVKVMSAGAGADDDSRARFKREAQAAARLQHAAFEAVELLCRVRIARDADEHALLTGKPAFDIVEIEAPGL